MKIIFPSPLKLTPNPLSWEERGLFSGESFSFEEKGGGGVAGAG